MIAADDVIFEPDVDYAPLGSRQQVYVEPLPQIYKYDWRFGRKPPHHKWFHKERNAGVSNGDYFMARYPEEDSPQRRAEVQADIAAIESIRDDVSAQFNALIEMLRKDMLT